MSVLIKGMEMPNSCGNCPLRRCNENRTWCSVIGKYIDFDKEYDGRRSDCPLVEIPTPHGRLIDATFEENHYASMLLNPTPDVTEQDKHKAKIIIDALHMARTVIGAEGSET